MLNEFWKRAEGCGRDEYGRGFRAGAVDALEHFVSILGAVRGQRQGNVGLVDAADAQLHEFIDELAAASERDPSPYNTGRSDAFDAGLDTAMKIMSAWSQGS